MPCCSRRKGRSQNSTDPGVFPNVSNVSILIATYVCAELDRYIQRHASTTKLYLSSSYLKGNTAKQLLYFIVMVTDQESSQMQSPPTTAPRRRWIHSLLLHPHPLNPQKTHLPPDADEEKTVSSEDRENSKELSPKQTPQLETPLSRESPPLQKQALAH